MVARLGFGFVALLFVFSASGGDVNLPKGFVLFEFGDETDFNRWPSINNNGQFVWHWCPNPADGNSCEIMLYDNGRVIQVTNNNILDQLPDINDEGTIVWARQTPGLGGIHDIVMLRDGEMTFITDNANDLDPRDNKTPRINNLGHIAWFRRSDFQCSGSDSEIWFFDGEKSSAVSDLGLTNQSLRMNDLDEVVWTHVDTCLPSRPAQVWYDGFGFTETVASAPMYNRPQRPDISNDGTIVWSHQTPTEFENAIIMRSGSIEVELSDWGYGPYISNNGEYVSFNRWFESNFSWQVMRWHNGELLQITDNDIWDVDPDVNDFGEMVWTSGPVSTANWNTNAIVLAAPGDLNCDALISVSDIPAFVTALVNEQEYESLFPNCERMLADLNGDSLITVSDIAPFVGLLAGG